MAQFCAPCTEAVMGAPRELNDFRRNAPSGWAVVLCEGCGFHVVDRAGERMRGDEPTYAELSYGPKACLACYERGGIRDRGDRDETPPAS